MSNSTSGRFYFAKFYPKSGLSHQCARKSGVININNICISNLSIKGAAGTLKISSKKVTEEGLKIQLFFLLHLIPVMSEDNVNAATPNFNTKESDFT